MTEGVVATHWYDNEDLDFRKPVESILSVGPLERLHDSRLAPVSRAERDDQDFDVYRLLYAGYENLALLYERLLMEYVAPMFDEELVVQRVPTFRVHCPGGTAVNAFHRDSEYNHPDGIVNFWVPLTASFDTNTLWIETDVDSGAYAPANLHVGQFLQFDAIRLRHGNKVNTTAQTRVSFDFRVISRRRFAVDGRRSVSSGIPLELGAYYALLTPAGLR